MIQTERLHDLFHREVPDQVVRAIVRAIETGYRASSECCQEQYAREIQHQAWGYHRWLQIDSELLAVGQRFGNTSRFESNTEQTHIGHTELHFGRLVLTATCVQTRGCIPKYAKYREQLAVSNQFSLFPERVKRHAQNDKIWVAIMHVPNVAARTPLHIYAAFVTTDQDGVGFACEHIDLVQIAEAQDSLVVHTKPALRLRSRSKTGE